MATGLVHRAMIYLGLVDDDYEDYEVYEEVPPPQQRPAPRAMYAETDLPGGGVRTLQREMMLRDDPTGGQGAISPRPAVVRPMPSPAQSAKVHVVAPQKFPDAQEIGDRFKNNQP